MALRAAFISAFTMAALFSINFISSSLFTIIISWKRSEHHGLNLWNLFLKAVHKKQLTLPEIPLSRQRVVFFFLTASATTFTSSLNDKLDSVVEHASLGFHTTT